MKTRRLAFLALLAAATSTLSSCGAAGSVLQQTNRAVQAVGRSVTGGR